LKNRIAFVALGAEEKAFFQLYVAVRSEELGMHNWAPDLREATLRLQFEAQTRAYREQFPAADECLILRDGSPIGWLIVDRSSRELHCIDIAIVPGEQGKGVGTEVLSRLQEEAAVKNAVIILTVLRMNYRALALYQRLGFRMTREDDLHAVMEWRQ
jgi:ribosomal protein S18 acetylase RimI-like enzyme